MAKGCDDNALLRYILNLLPDEEAVETRRHLAECPSCVAYLSTFQKPDEELPRRPEPNRAVDELLARPPDLWERLFAVDHARYATPAAVQALIQACEAALDHDLARADLISSLLTESADALPVGFASRTLQALAWTRRATVLLRLGHLLDARAAVAVAHVRANHIPAADFERALIAFTSADILREMGETGEALRQIREAAIVFLSYNDRRRHASAREMEGAVLFRMGEYDAAADVFCSLLTANPSDPIVRARLAANAAQAFVKTGKYESALPLFATAEKLFAERGYDSYVARIIWGRARARHALGDDDALVELREVWARFERLHADPEWIRVGIELVEWLLPLDAFEEVRSICVVVHERAVAAPMPLEALEAISYLREAALAETLTSGRAQYVRTFLEVLPSSPRAQFQLPS